MSPRAAVAVLALLLTGAAIGARAAIGSPVARESVEPSATLREHRARPATVLQDPGPCVVSENDRVAFLPHIASPPAPAASDPRPSPRSEPVHHEQPDLALRVRLLDRRTSEPVPWCEVSLRQGEERVVLCRSDESGWIRTEPGFRAGIVTLTRVGADASRSSGATELLAVPEEDGLTTAEPSVQLDVGPTYRIAFLDPPPARIAELHADLHVGGASRGTALLREDGDSVWVRFADPVEEPISLAIGSEEPARILVRSRDAAWRASGVVGALVGRAASVVVLSLDALGSITGRVEDASGQPIAIPVFLTGLEDDRGTRSTTASADGVFAFPGLEAGPYALECADARFLTWSQRVDVESGGSTSASIVLEPVAEGAVQGRLRSRTGTYALPLTITLDREGDAVPHRISVTRWIEDRGELVAPFAFEHVRIGEYRLRIQAAGGFLWDPPDLRVRVPASDLEAVCLDDVEPTALCFAVSELATGRTLHGFGVEARATTPDGQVLVAREACVQPDVPWMRVAAGTELAWSLRVPGYRPAYGSEADFRDHDGGVNVRRAEVRLRRGWGLEIEVLCREGERVVPVEDARVLLDGVLAARTNAEGLARPESETPPGVVEVRHPGWRISGAVHPRAVALKDVIARAVVWLERDEGTSYGE